MERWLFINISKKIVVNRSKTECLTKTFPKPSCQQKENNAYFYGKISVKLLASNIEVLSGGIK